MHSNDLFRYSPESDLSNDDTEDGSDEDFGRGPGSGFASSQRTEYAGIKEQMYQVKRLKPSIIVLDLIVYRLLGRLFVSMVLEKANCRT